MKALSLWQPWAAAVIYAGKDVENRGWRTSYRGPLLIHAAKRKPTTRELTHFADALFSMIDDRREAADVVVKVLRETVHRGGIVGRVEVVDCVSRSDSRWFSGPHALVLAKPEPLPFKEVRGYQGFFEVEL